MDEQDAGLTRIKSALQTIRAQAAQFIQKRTEAEDTLYCRWDGQSADGRKHAADLGRQAKPFEGASDARIRLAERILNEQVAQEVTAASRVIPRFRGMEGTDEAAAGKMSTALRWTIENYWGPKYRQTLELLSRYAKLDAGGSVAYVDWVEEWALDARRQEWPDVLGAIVETLAEESGGEVDPDTLAMIQAAPDDPESDSWLAPWMERAYGPMRPASVRRALKELRRDGVAVFPVRYLKKDGPEIVALRLWDDVWFRTNVTDLQRAPEIVVRQWLSRVDVLARAATEKWAPAFVKELLGEDDATDPDLAGKAGLTIFEEVEGQSDPLDCLEADPRRGLYEILTVFERDVDEDGLPGIFYTVCSGLCDELPMKRKLFDRRHGMMPFVAFGREALSSRVVDTRSLAELVASQQDALKLMHDAMNDHVQLFVHPPMQVPKGKARFDLGTGPMAQLEAGPRDVYRYVERPAFPVAAEWMHTEIRRDVNEFWGRAGVDVDPQLVLMLTQMRVDRFLTSVRECLMMVVQLIQERMPPERLLRIVGGQGVETPGTTEEIQGRFDMSLSVDVRDWDMEFLLKKAKVMLEYVRPLDVRASVRYETVVKRILEGIDPNWAEESMMAPEEADGREAREERQALVAMLNGVRPEMPEAGLNAPLRAKVLEEELARRAAGGGAFGPITPAAQMLIEERRKYLEFQAAQTQNASTGRLGVDPTKTDEAMAEAGAGMGGAPGAGQVENPAMGMMEI